MINEHTKAWFHGCWWPHLGHHLHGSPTAKREECPWDRMYLEDSIDGGYAPRRMHDGYDLPECANAQRADRLVFLNMVPSEQRPKLSYNSDEFPEGHFLYHQARGCSLISWYDRNQGDTRRNCYSTFIVEGMHTVADVLAWFPQFFPLQAKRLAIGNNGLGVDLVCVNVC